MVGWRITEGEVGGRGVRWMRDREGGRIEGFRYTRDGNRGNLADISVGGEDIVDAIHLIKVSLSS